ncbi:MAG: thiamine-phosphate kinase [Geminicoccaceae bacterium]|nr:thiamine-phosphate kinase [Geminicoccaceae bacterium]
MSLGEFEFIARLLRPLARGFAGALDLGDDAALVDVPAGYQLVVAKDAIVENVHFFSEDPPEQVAAKLLRVNLSDLAAMGADPLAYLTMIARPPSASDSWLEAFVRGLAEDQSRFEVHLIGGDTVATSGPLVLSLTILGLVPRGAALERRGARPGDLVCVSGTLGDAAMALRIQRGLAVPEDLVEPLLARYRLPTPRIALGRALRGLATAAIDVSDGLLADLGHVLERSGVGAEIEVARLPLSEATRGLPGARACALAGGDDYELLFTLPPDRADLLPDLAVRAQVPLSVIGRITAEPCLRVLDENGRPLAVERTGYRHF